MNRLALLLLLTTCFWGCQQDAIDHNDQFLKNKAPLVFRITMDKDTTLQLASGTVIHIPAGTFAKSKNGQVDLEVIELLSKEDMIRWGVSTITDSLDLLESGGMMHLAVIPQQPLKEQVLVQMKAHGINPDMRHFVGIDDGERIVWRYQDQLENKAEQQTLIKGKRLYQTHCANCHSNNLREKLTGPALGNVHIYRDIDWLIEFTKKSQSMIATGNDPISLCLWYEWGPTVMSHFEDVLTDEEIRNIYTFIENESKLTKIDSTEVRYVLACPRDTIVVNPNTINESITIDQVFYSNQDTVQSSYTNRTQPSFSLDTVTGTLPTDYNYYPFYVRPGWNNIDQFLKAEAAGVRMIEVEDLKLEVNSDTHLYNMMVVLVYEEKEVLLRLARTGSQSFHLGFRRPIKLLPETASFLVFGEKQGQFYFAKKEIDDWSQSTFQVDIKAADKQAIDFYLNRKN